MSAVGKDRIQKELEKHNFYRIVSTTTRPKRKGEIEGKDYFFVNDEEFHEMQKAGKFVEHRSYNTFQDGKPTVWNYAAPAVDYDAHDWVIVLDKSGTDEYVKYYGKNKCFTVLVTASNETRMKRAQLRGSFDLQEWNRRLKDDEKVFANVKTDFTIANEGEIEVTINAILDAITKRNTI